MKPNYKNNKIANHCNQFIISHLLKVRGIAYKTRNDRKFAIYNTAIQSVRRYPLPLICTTQLKMLNGIGQCLSEQLTKLIKNHYKNYINCNSVHQTNSQQPSLDQQFSQNEQLKEMDADEIDDKSVKSAIVPRTYKPRVNTLAAQVLMAASKLSERYKSFNKKQLTDFMKEQSGEIIKGVTSVLNTLQTHGYITQQAGQIAVTEKGKNFTVQLNQKHIVFTSKHKVLTQVSNFKSRIEQKKILEDQEDNQQPLFIKQQISYNQTSVLTLLIDSRQVRNQSDRNYFQEKLKQKYNINCKIGGLSIGDFIWLIDDNVLDLIIERKKADDLASSIMDGRYKQQKYRLKASQISSIFYLYEGHPSFNSNKNQKELDNALLKTRIKQGFKIVKTKNINQSLKFLAFIHRQLEQKMKKQEKILTVGDLNSFNKYNSKKGGLTTQLVFGLGIKCFPGIGKANVGNLMKYFKTFRTLHDKLKELQNQDERIQFIRQLLKKGRAPNNFPNLIVNLLFNNIYE